MKKLWFMVTEYRSGRHKYWVDSEEIAELRMNMRKYDEFQERIEKLENSIQYYIKEHENKYHNPQVDELSGKSPSQYELRFKIESLFDKLMDEDKYHIDSCEVLETDAYEPRGKILTIKFKEKK